MSVLQFIKIYVKSNDKCHLELLYNFLVDNDFSVEIVGNELFVDEMITTNWSYFDEMKAELKNFIKKKQLKVYLEMEVYYLNEPDHTFLLNTLEDDKNK